MLAQVNVAVKGTPWTKSSDGSWESTSTWGGGFDMTLTFRPSCCVPNPDVEDDRCSRFIAAPFDAAEASKFGEKVKCSAVEGLPDRHRVCDMKVEPLTKDDRDVRVALQKCPAMDSDIKFKSTVVKLTAYDFDTYAYDADFNPGSKAKGGDSHEIFTFYNYLEYQFVQPTYDMSAVQGCDTPWSQLPGKPYTRGDDSLCPSGNCEDSPTDAKLLDWYNEYSAGRNGECEGFKLSKDPLIGEYVDATNVELDIEERKTGTFCPDFDDYVVGGTCEYKDGVFTALRIGRGVDNPTSAYVLNDVQAKSAVTVAYDLGEGFFRFRFDAASDGGGGRNLLFGGAAKDVECALPPPPPFAHGPSYMLVAQQKPGDSPLKKEK
jgi:hypothetical protein